ASSPPAAHEVAAAAIAAEGASEEVAAREGAEGVAGITRHDGDTEIAALADASHRGAESLAARPIASHIAPPRAAETREATLPTLAHASLARTAHPGAPAHGAPR